MIHIAKRETHEIGKYRITLLYDDKGNLLGALIDGPKMSKPLYIAHQEEVILKLPKQVIKFLNKQGFKVKRP